MGKADRLSRRLDWQERVERNNKDQCYETPKEERTSRAFRNLIDNIKLHNRVKL